MSNAKNDRTEALFPENRYVKMLDRIAEGCQIISPEWKYLYVNEAAAKHGNQTKETLIGANMIDVYPDIKDTEIFRVLRQCMEHREQQSIKSEFTFPDGSKRWFNLNIQPDPGGLFITSIEITDQKQAEEALEESKAFLDNISDIAYIADNQGNLKWINLAVRRVTGFLPEQLIGKPFLPLFIEDDHTSLIDVYQRTLNGETLENTLTFKTGVTCHFSSLPKRNKQGDIIGTFGLARDISERQAAEHALQVNEARLKRALTISRVGNWEYDITTGKVWGSEEAFKIYGVERISEFLPLDEIESYIIDAKRVNQALVDLIAKNKAYDIEFQIKPKNRKELIHVHSMAELVYGKDRTPEKVVGVIHDITENKQAEEILHENHAMLKRTEAMANIGSWEWDVHNDRAYWSEELFRIFGRDPAEGAPSLAEQSKFYTNGDIQRLQDAVEVCVTQGTPYEIELGAVRTDGEIRHCVSRGQPQYDENGKVFRIAGSFQDITDRKQSENHIKSLERRNLALLDHSPVCHKIVDLDFNLKYMSANGFKMLQLDENIEVYGKPYPFYFFPEAFQSEMKQKLKKAIEIGETITMEALTNDFQGNEVWLDSSLIPIFDDDHKIEYLTVVSANVTQRKRDEKEKAHLEGQLRQAQKMEAIGRLAGGVAHDFNNMLSVIMGNAEMALEDVAPSQPIYERLEEIKRAGARSADLTRQLLAFARKQTVSPKVLDLNKTVVNMTSMLRRLIGEDIDLAWRPGEDVWPVKVDPSQIDQILANLCVNARDAIADVGRVTIETSNAVFDEAYCSEHLGFSPGEYVRLAVSDNGCGMDHDIRDNIFEPFFTTKESGRGTGLGLAMVYGVIKQNNGFINVYSEPGQGTTFSIYLPRYRSRSKLEAMPDSMKNPRVKPGHETILLVEDEIVILRLTAQMLEKLGYQVISARTPGEAIRLSREHAGEINLLLTDVVMPEMNGRDLAKNILSIYPNLQRLFMSGYTANVIAHHGILDEGVNFIQKPFSKEQLGIKLREVLDGDDA